MPKFDKDTAKEAGKKSKRGISEKTKQWETLGEAITGKFTNKLEQEMNKLDGKEFINAYAMILEYFKPKQLRTEIKDETIREITVRLPDADKPD